MKPEGQNIYNRERQDANAIGYERAVGYLRIKGLLSTPAFEHFLEAALQRECGSEPTKPTSRNP